MAAQTWSASFDTLQGRNPLLEYNHSADQGSVPIQPGPLPAGYFLRGTLEYGSAERGDLWAPYTGRPLESCDEDGCEPLDGSDGNDILVEALLSYEPSPGTVFFLGYTRQMEDSRRFGFEAVQPTADGLFAKLSYRFRM